MKNNNTMSPREYLGNHIFWLLIVMLWYRNIFFISLPQISVALSKMILWIFAIVLSTIGWLTTAKRRRNNLSLAVNTILPYEVYTVFAYHSYLPWLVWISIVISGIAVIVFFCLVMSSPIKNHSRKNVIIRRRLKHVFALSRVLVAVCLLLLIVPTGLRLVFGHGLLETNVAPILTSRENEEWTVKNNIDVVCLLTEEEWAQLNEQEKLDVLGVIANIEIRYLGINHELYLKSAVLDEDTAAHYNHRNHEIVIDLDHLRTSEAADVLDSLCHECYHSYQHQMIELYDSAGSKYQNMLVFQHVDDYIEEFNNYSDGSENILDYYYQTTEITARRYASESVVDYYELIDEYSSGG